MKLENDFQKTIYSYVKMMSGISNDDVKLTISKIIEICGLSNIKNSRRRASYEVNKMIDNKVLREIKAPTFTSARIVELGENI